MKREGEVEVGVRFEEERYNGDKRNIQGAGTGPGKPG